MPKSLEAAFGPVNVPVYSGGWGHGAEGWSRIPTLSFRAAVMVVSEKALVQWSQRCSSSDASCAKTVAHDEVQLEMTTWRARRALALAGGGATARGAGTGGRGDGAPRRGPAGLLPHTGGAGEGRRRRVVWGGGGGGGLGGRGEGQREMDKG